MRQYMVCSISVVLLGILSLSWVKAEEQSHSQIVHERRLTYAALMEKYGLKPGMRIYKENADLIKELVPDDFARRVKNGDFGITIGELEAPDILERAFPKEFYKASEQLVGRFDIDTETLTVIDKAAGKRIWPMPYGLPFPTLDLDEDPRIVGAKILWNATAVQALFPDTESFSRTFSAPDWGAPNIFFNQVQAKQFIDFRREPLDIRAPLAFANINFTLYPADAFGGVNLTWRWADPTKWDSVWSYSPSNRRVRRQTSANRSDSSGGTEFVTDDSNLYSGKVEQFDWKFIGVRAALRGVHILAAQAEDDYIAYAVNVGRPASRSRVPSAYSVQPKKQSVSYEVGKKDYTSWWNDAILWVPVAMYVVEGIPKDPYYNYGRQILWYDAHTFTGVWKEIYNRAGEYWRTFSSSQELVISPNDKNLAAQDTPGSFIYDVLSNRGTINLDPLDKLAEFHTEFDPNVFAVSRFMNYGK